MTSALINIKNIVRKFLFKYKISDDDYIIYLEHAYDMVRNLSLFHSKYFNTEKLTTDSIGSAALPDDLLEITKVFNNYNGRMWTFTEKNDMFIQDLTGEANYPDDQVFGFGARGAINPYYYKVDWANRRIYIDGLGAGAEFYINYIGTGITADTTVPASANEVFDNYLKWRYAEINKMSVTERRERERNYNNSLLMFRRTFIPSAEVMADTFRSLYSQVPQR